MAEAEGEAEGPLGVRRRQKQARGVRQRSEAEGEAEEPLRGEAEGVRKRG